MARLLIPLLLVLVVWWLLRSANRRPPAPGPKPAQPAHEEMVACAQCGVHLPRSEALPGRGGVFCGEAHRRVFEQAQAGP